MPTARGRGRPAQRRPWSWSRPHAPWASSSHGARGQRLGATSPSWCRGEAAGRFLPAPCTSPRSPGTGRPGRGGRKPGGPRRPRGALAGAARWRPGPGGPGADAARRRPSRGAGRGPGAPRAQRSRAVASVRSRAPPPPRRWWPRAGAAGRCATPCGRAPRAPGWSPGGRGVRRGPGRWRVPAESRDWLLGHQVCS